MGAGLKISELLTPVSAILLNNHRRRASMIATGCLMVILILTLYPYTQSGFYFDDIYNSELNGVLSVLHLNLSQFISKMLDLWVVQTGRFFPASITIVYSFWAIAEDLHVYRALQVGLVVIDMGLFWLLIRKISDSPWLASLTIFFLPILFQFNPNLDGVTSFGPLNQGVLLFVLLSWLLTYRYVSSEKFMPISLGFAAICEMVALTFYEVGVLVIPGLIGIAYYTAVRAKRRHFSIAVSLLTASIFFAFYIWFAVHKAAAYSGSEIGSIRLIPETMLAQFFSAFPLALLKNMGVSAFISSHVVKLLFGWLVVSAVAMIFLFQSLHHIESDSAKIAAQKKLLFIIFFCLAVVPAGVLSVSKYHQQIQSYGNPQSVVFIQIFGIALFLALILNWLIGTKISSTRKTLQIGVFSVVFALIFTLTTSLNFRRILEMNETYLKPRQNMEQMLHMGLLDSLPEDSLLMIEDTYPWERGDLIFSNLGASSAFFTHHAGRIVRSQTADSIIKGGVPLPNVPGHLFLMKRDSDLGRVVVNNESQRTIIVRAPSEKPGSYILTRESGNFSMSLMPLTAGDIGAWQGNSDKRFAWAGTKGQIRITNVATNSTFINTKVVLLSPDERYVDVTSAERKQHIHLLAGKSQLVDIKLSNVHFGETGIVTFESKEPGGIIDPHDIELKYQIQYFHTN